MSPEVLAVSTTLLVPFASTVTLFGFNVRVGLLLPFGVIVATKLIDPENPYELVRFSVKLPEDPAVRVSVVGFDVIA